MGLLFIFGALDVFELGLGRPNVFRNLFQTVLFFFLSEASA